MRKELLKERLELLTLGEEMGYPRLGYGRGPQQQRLAIPRGQRNWERFCRFQPAKRGELGLLTALRVARIKGLGVRLPMVENAASAVTATTPAGIITITVPPSVIRLDDPLEDDPLVKPKRSAAAIRQARWRQNRKKEKR